MFSVPSDARRKGFFLASGACLVVGVIGEAEEEVEGDLEGSVK